MATLAGPFGTYDALSLSFRAAYWAGIVSMATLMGFTVRAIIAAMISRTMPVVADLASAGLMTVFFAPYVFVLRGYFSTLGDGLVVSAVSISINTFLLALAIFVVRRQVCVDEPGGYLVPVEPDDDTRPRLLRRLSPEVQGDVVRLSANNHRVEVVTENGRQELRLRLSDAIDEMEPVKGLTPHRSHWVALDAVERVERENAQKFFLALRNGERVPLSRSYREKIDLEGLLLDQIIDRLH